MFFRLKAAGFLPAQLKAFLAKLLSKAFYSSTQACFCLPLCRLVTRGWR